MPHGHAKTKRHVAVNGYALVWNPTHPNAFPYGYVLEHVAVASKVLGKPLPPKAEVHHIDGNESNNRNDNLVVCQDDAYHKLLHLRERALREGGNANFRRCYYCRKWDDVSRLRIYSQTNPHHAACLNEHRRKRKEAACG